MIHAGQCMVLISKVTDSFVQLDDILAPEQPVFPDRLEVGEQFPDDGFAVQLQLVVEAQESCMDFPLGDLGDGTVVFAAVMIPAPPIGDPPVGFFRNIVPHAPQ